MPVDISNKATLTERDKAVADGFTYIFHFLEGTVYADHEKNITHFTKDVVVSKHPCMIDQVVVYRIQTPQTKGIAIVSWSEYQMDIF